MSRTPLLTLALLGLSSFAHAQEDTQAPPPQVIYRAVSEVTFDPADIDALPERPDGALVWEPPPRTHISFIQLRADFNEEMAESVSQVK